MTPDELDAVRRRWSRDDGMGNQRSDEDYTDAGCRILARAGFADVESLLAEVNRLRERKHFWVEVAGRHRDDVDRFTTQIQLVRELHFAADHRTFCGHCGYNWPCPTIGAAS